MKQKKGKEGADGEVEWVEVGGDRGEEYGEVGKRHSKGRRKGRGDYIGVRVRPPPAEASLAPPRRPGTNGETLFRWPRMRPRFVIVSAWHPAEARGGGFCARSDFGDFV